jgi:hypothetical protein
MDTDTQLRDRTDTLARRLPLAGAAYAVLQITGDLAIGPFPGGETSTSDLTDFYHRHHAQVATGGRLLEASAIFLALFGVAVCLRARRSPVVAVIIAVGAAMAAEETATSGATYNFLGTISTGSHLTPQALQAWHLAGAEFGIGAGFTLLMVGIALAGLRTHAVPQWLGWSGLALGLAQMTTFGFLALMLSLVWALVAGIVMTLRDPATD